MILNTPPQAGAYRSHAPSLLHMYLTREGPPERAHWKRSIEEGLSERVRRRRSDGEGLMEKVRWRRFNEEGLTEKV